MRMRADHRKPATTTQIQKMNSSAAVPRLTPPRLWAQLRPWCSHPWLLLRLANSLPKCSSARLTSTRHLSTCGLVPHG